MRLPDPNAARIQQAAQLFRQNQLAAADALLAPLAPVSVNPDLLHLLGLVRLQQQQTEDAAALFTRAIALDPRRAPLQAHLGKALMLLKRFEPACEALRAATKLKPDFAEAWYDLGNTLQELGRPEEAENAYRRVLRLTPADGYAKLALGSVMLLLGRPQEAETLLQRALADPADTQLRSSQHYNLAIALHRQRKVKEALDHIEKAQALDPRHTGLDVYRVDILQELKRHDEALGVLRATIARDPADAIAHHDYNDLLYRLGREEEFLKSYDAAPPISALQNAKATFLTSAGRAGEAHEVYAGVLARDPGNRGAASGIALALLQMGQTGDAVAAYDRFLSRHDGDVSVYGDAAAALVRHGDPVKAMAMCEKGLALSPHSQVCLAVMGTALRMMGDEREEILNGYETFIRVFDLDPPQGFSDMAAFNAELCGHLEQLIPETREHLFQTLRGGRQTINSLFGAGHDLVDRLQKRIDETVGRYIAEMKQDEHHPFLARRAGGFSYAGSWSSRLADCGYHVSHLHPAGWISSCYYAGVPDAVQDEAAKQGWIKFGEPGFDSPLENPVRRAVQPEPGRLVLFPSYMWHGTIPFRSAQPRITIAFDVVPA